MYVLQLFGGSLLVRIVADRMLLNDGVVGVSLEFSFRSIVRSFSRQSHLLNSSAASSLRINARSAPGARRRHAQEGLAFRVGARHGRSGALWCRLHD